MALRSGRLRDRIRIQKPVPTRDSMGGQLTVWQDVAGPRSAEVTPLSGRADTETEALTGLQTYRVTMRYERALRFVDATHRILWDGRVLKVLGAVTDGGMRQEIQLTCEVGAGVVTGGPEAADDPDGPGATGLIFTTPTNSQYVPLVSF